MGSKGGVTGVQQALSGDPGGGHFELVELGLTLISAYILGTLVVLKNANGLVMVTGPFTQHPPESDNPSSKDDGLGL